MNKYIKYLLKGLFLFAMVYIILLMVVNDENSTKLYSIEDKINTRFYSTIIIVFVLQFFNWGLESLKFQYILSKKKQVSYRDSVLAVYTGNATGLFTPDRLGNFIGRFIYLKKYNKKTVTAATMLGNLAQLISTICFAFIALLLYLNIDLKIIIPYINPKLIITFTIVILIFLSISFFFPKRVINIFNKIKFMAKHKNTYSFLATFTIKQSGYILSLSLLRYTVFIIQYYLLLTVLGLEITLIETIVFSGLLYLFTTLIPSPFLGNLGTREVLALLLLSNYQQPEIALVASLIIWLVNVIFPSLIGSFLLIKMNPSKKKV